MKTDQHPSDSSNQSRENGHTAAHAHNHEHDHTCCECGSHSEQTASGGGKSSAGKKSQGKPSLNRTTTHGKYTVAIVGATGLVGSEILSILQQRRFPIKTLCPLASERSIGTYVDFFEEEIPVQVLSADSFEGVDLAFFCAGGAVSREFVPIAAKAGAIVIDNSSAFRHHHGVPLVVPEVNPQALNMVGREARIIANPNCSTIQLVTAVNPLHKAAGLESMTVATYQSASGAGRQGMNELAEQTINLLSGEDITISVHKRRLAFNVVPQIGDLDSDGFSTEERKLMNESVEILGIPNLKVAATAARVPVFVGHSEAVNARFSRELSVTEAREILRNAPGVVLLDDPSAEVYPTVLDTTEQDPVFVGRIRKDPTSPRGLMLWIVADNLRKGAALNAVQIGELILDRI